jgi:hypothetical protein
MGARISSLKTAVFFAILFFAIIEPNSVFGSVYAESNFDDGLEGWSAITTDATILWSSEGGNPGGYFQLVETQHLGNRSWAVAPAKFLGNWSILDGNARLCADLKLISGAPIQDIFRFEIGGPGGQALKTCAIGSSMKGQWGRFSVPISQSEWDVSQGTWDGLLSNVEYLGIEIEHVVGNEVTGLDNVKLEIVDEPIIRRLVISATSGGDIISPGEGEFEYSETSTVSIEAMAHEGYSFVSWVGTAVNAGKVADPHLPSTNVVVDGDYAIQAMFHSTPSPEGVEVGQLFITGDEIVRIDDDEWSISGNVRVNDFLRLTGTVSANTATLRVNGNGQIWVDEVKIYDGPWEFDGQTAATTAINETLSSLELVGMNVRCTYLGIEDTAVKIQGYVNLPECAGGGKIDFTGNHYLKVSTEKGLEYDFTLYQEIDVNLAGISFKAENSSIYMSNKTGNDVCKIYGLFELSNWGVIVDLNPDEGRYISIEKAGNEVKVELVGSITIAYVEIIPEDVIYGKNLSLDFNTVSGDYYATGTLGFPVGAMKVDADCTLGILGGEFDSASIIASFDPPPPILSTPAGIPVVYLLHIGGGISNIASESAIVIMVTAGLQGGPDFFGHKLVTLDLTGEVDLSGSVTGTALLDILTIDEENAVFTGEASVTVYVATGMELQASLEAGEDFLRLNGDLSVDLNNNFSGSLEGTLTIPEDAPLIGIFLSGLEFPVIGYAQSVDDDDTTNDYISVGTQIEIDLPEVGHKQYDVTVILMLATGEWEWNVEEVERQEQIAFADIRTSSLFETNSSQQAFYIAPNTDYVIFRATWETGTTDLHIITPMGATITPENVDLYPNILYYTNELVPEAFYIINEPMAGSWKLLLSDDTGIGQYILQPLQRNESPNITIVEPATNVSEPNVLITWSDFDSDDNASITLYYDRDCQGANGTLIISGLSENDSNDSYLWKTSEVPTGDYYIYALITDGKHSPIVSYSTGKVHVVDPNAPSPPNNLAVSPTGLYNELLLTWSHSKDPNLNHYNVHYTADAAGENYEQVRGTGRNNFLTITGLLYGETYRVAVAAVNDNDNVGPLSEPVIVTLQHEINNIPVFTGEVPSWARIGELYEFGVLAEDLDADWITCSLACGDPNLPKPPAGLTISEGGLIQWIPEPNQIGHHAFGICLDDGNSGVNVEQFEVFVIDGTSSNKAPEVLSEAPSITIPGSLYVYQLIARDLESSNRLDFALLEHPNGAIIDANGLIEWIVPEHSDRYEFLVKVTDELGLYTLQRFTIQVDLNAPFMSMDSWGSVASTDTDNIDVIIKPTPDATGLVEYQCEIDGDASDWQSMPMFKKGMLPPNTMCTVRVKARDASPTLNETPWSEPRSVYTLAEIPPAPSFVSSDVYSITVMLSAGINPETTELALYNKSTEHWISPDGEPSGEPVWAIPSHWNSVSIDILEFNRTYQLQCKAKNGNGIETKLSQVLDARTKAPLSSANLIADKNWLCEYVDGAARDTITLSAEFMNDPYLNEDYLYFWETPVNTTTGQALLTVSGGGPNDSTVTYEVPDSSANHPATYTVNCTIIGRKVGNSVSSTAQINVLRCSDLTCLVPENADKRVLVPTGDIEESWRDTHFDDSNWLKGVGDPGGVGYERVRDYEQNISLDVVEQMYNQNTTCYIRIPFTVSSNPSGLNFLALNIQYDDGFVAYINGIEVQRRLFTGTPAWNSQADGDHEAGGVESFDISGHINALRQGQNVLAIHGLNVSTTSSDFLISVELLAGTLR